jgi:hypothetical protein
VQNFLSSGENEVMSDYETETMRRRREQERREYAEYQSPANQLQRTLDWNWQMKLAKDAEAAYRRRAPDEHPERGEYSPIARYERETGRR